MAPPTHWIAKDYVYINKANLHNSFDANDGMYK